MVGKKAISKYYTGFFINCNPFLKKKFILLQFLKIQPEKKRLTFLGVPIFGEKIGET